MAMGFDDARHFLSRIGVGGTPAEIESTAKLTRSKAVDLALNSWRPEPSKSMPKWVGEPVRPRREMLERAGSREDFQRELRDRAFELKSWWLDEITRTRAPLTETMVLLWHNHFTSSFRKVRRPTLLARQNALFREHALGDFRALLGEVARDPAMLVYLDNFRNFEGAPNENFARELLELFTIGIGNYAESDVKAAARAFTGWTVNRRTGDFRLVARRHDDGPKTFLGARGRFDGDAIIERLLAHPQTSKRIVERVWGEFVAAPPTAAKRAELEGRFARDFDLRALVRATLTSAAFWSAENRGAMIKSPVELVAGTARVLGLGEVGRQGVKACRALGQDLFDPPNVKGWAGGTSWVTASTLLRRQELMRRAAALPGGYRREEAWFGRAASDDELARRIQAVLLPVPGVEKTPEARSVPQFVGQLLSDPAYQLK